jgi:hypothetical protein
VSNTLSDKTLSDFAALTPEIDKEVTLYNGEGGINYFWCARAYGSVVVVTTRKPGRAAKCVSIVDHSTPTRAEYWIRGGAAEREKRVPIIRQAKAEAALLLMITESGTPIEKLLAWSRTGGINVMFDKADYPHWGWMNPLSDTDPQSVEPNRVRLIMKALRRKGDSYFGGLKLARHFIEQIKPGGLADRLIASVIEMVEKNLVPWAYIAGHLGAKVVMANDSRFLAQGLIARHANTNNHGELGFYHAAYTVERLVEIVYNRCVKDAAPDVLDALTLE